MRLAEKESGGIETEEWVIDLIERVSAHHSPDDGDDEFRRNFVFR